MENSKDSRREHLLFLRRQVAQLYQERLDRKYGKPSYNAKMRALLAGRLGTLDWALEQNERS
jgi:hypothetical protein